MSTRGIPKGPGALAVHSPVFVELLVALGSPLQSVGTRHGEAQALLDILRREYSQKIIISPEMVQTYHVGLFTGHPHLLSQRSLREQFEAGRIGSENISYLGTGFAADWVLEAPEMGGLVIPADQNHSARARTIMVPNLRTGNLGYQTIMWRDECGLLEVEGSERRRHLLFDMGSYASHLGVFNHRYVKEDF